MSLADLCRKTADNALLVVGGAAILAGPLVATNHVGYKLARISYGEEPCVEYQRPQQENIIAYATLGIGRDLYIQDTCGTKR